MRLLLIALMFFASTALAQTTGTIVLTTQNNDTSTIRVPKEPCDLVRTVNWKFVSSGAEICSSLQFWLASGSGSCADAPTSADFKVDEVTQSQLLTQATGQVSFKVQDLPGFKGTNAVSCPADGREDAYTLCAAVKLGGAIITGSACGSGSYQKTDLDVVYDALPPDAPSIDKVSALDKALSVKVAIPSDASEVKLLVERADGTSSRTVTQSADQTLFHVEGLENGVTYQVSATAVDAADNESAASEIEEGTPIHTLGFYDRYVEANGQESGGCGAAAGGLTGGGVLAVLGLWLSSRRNRS
jgi:hypothetical protein